MWFENAGENISEAARWRLIRRQVIERVIAVTTGIALLFFVAFLPLQSFANAVSLWFAADIVIYVIAGVVLGFIWPNSGWRLGPYLFAIWPVFIILNVLISDRPPVIHWKEELLGLFGLLMILPGACLGAWVGSMLRRRFLGDVSRIDRQTLSTS